MQQGVSTLLTHMLFASLLMASKEEKEVPLLDNKYPSKYKISLQIKLQTCNLHTCKYFHFPAVYCISNEIIILV